MKNTVLSVVFAFFLLLVATHALSDVEINRTVLIAGEVYFSSDNDMYDINRVLVLETNNYVLLSNKLSTPNAVDMIAVLTHESDSESKINISKKNVQLSSGLNNSKQSLSLIMDEDDMEAGIYTGTMYVSKSSNSSLVYDSVPVKILVPAVEITDITVKDATDDIKDTKLEKGQKIKVIVEYQNVAQNTDLEGMKLEVSLRDDSETGNIFVNLNDDKLEDEKKNFKLTNEKTGTAEFEFEMPYTIDDGDTITVLAEMIQASAEKTTSEFYSKLAYDVEAYVADNRVEITKFTASPSSLACGINRAKITAEVRNVGDSNEDVQLFMRSTDGFEKQLNSLEDIELGTDFEDEEDFTKSVEEIVTLTDLKEGANTYSLIAYYNDGDANTQKDIIITSQSCTPTVETALCTESDWSSVLSPLVCPSTGQQTKIWSKSRTCTGGVSHPASEIISCSDLFVDPTIIPVTPTSSPSYVTLKDVSGFGLDSDLILPVAIGIGGLIVGVIVAMVLIPRP